ncbi:MAG TPA: nitrite reductase small subunit NirD, partial [Polyangiaceae bacterium]|nr:nitrite reductase small subunit NirD [Polyangiaceae bacterium]
MIGQDEQRQWIDVCDYQKLERDRGVCALVGGEQVAIFRLSPDDELFAISNFDPFSKAFVLSRGIVGTKGDIVKVASPVYKQSFDLRTGLCLDDPTVKVRTYAVQVEGSRVKVGLARRPAQEEGEPSLASPAGSKARAAAAPSVRRPLAGRTVALAETRELDVLNRMLVAKGATTISYPIVRIVDSPDAAPVEQFVRELTAGGMDALVLSTGEGVRRLIGFAERAKTKDALIASLQGIVTVARGPKPARALRELGILPTISADQPTTEGIIDAMQNRGWQGSRVGVQLCGQKPNSRLLHFLNGAGAVAKTVAPYAYAPGCDDERVAQLIRHMSTGEVDIVAFTCSAQVDRVFAVAKSRKIEDSLRRGFRRTRVAALGPVVATALRDRDCHVDIVPTRSFFM